RTPQTISLVEPSKIFVVAASAATLLCLGCRPARPLEAGASSTNVSASEVKREIREAADATKGYLAASKDEFVASVQEKLNKLDPQIAELETKTEALKDDAKAEGKKALASLREQRAQLGQKLDELR